MANQNLDHSVAILGWGVDPKTGTKVWIVRNSFG
ncbi:MAG: C1 family peptidase, partial [bacterium]